MCLAAKWASRPACVHTEPFTFQLFPHPHPSQGPITPLYPFDSPSSEFLEYSPLDLLILTAAQLGV